MNWLRLNALLMSAALFFVGCSDGNDPAPDGGVADAGPSDVGVADLGDGATDAGTDLGTPEPDAGTRFVFAGVGTNSTFDVPADGTTVLAVGGSQGGYHIEAGFLVQGFDVGPEWTVRYELRDSTGVVISSPISRLFTVQELMFDAGLGGQFRAGDNLVFTDFDPTLREGETATVFIEISMGGDVFTDTLSVVLDFP